MTAWNAMLRALLGEPLPPLPALPGRLHVAADAPLPPDEVAQAVADGCTAAELAALLCCSRPTAAAKLREMRERTQR